MNLTLGAEAVLKSLRDNNEGCALVEPDGREWCTVYLDNAVPAGMSAHSFAGYLSVLERAGLYSPIDGCFGDVLCEGKP